jgi:hypothetical protein
MKVLLIILLILFGLLGLGMSLCGGLGMVLLYKGLGVILAGGVLLVGVLFIMLAVKGINALNAPERTPELPKPEPIGPVDPPV